jgi:hypothetical protein
MGFRRYVSKSISNRQTFVCVVSDTKLASRLTRNTQSFGHKEHKELKEKTLCVIEIAQILHPRVGWFSGSIR